MVLVLTIVFLFTVLLSGCSDKKDNNVTSPQSENTQETEKPTETANEEHNKEEELEHVELIWYMLNTPQTDAESVYEEANKIIKEKINATVDFRTEDYGTMEEKMKMVIASGEKFDICWTSNWLNQYEPNVRRGAYLPLDELIDKYAPKTKETIPETVWDMTRIDGKIYGVPNYQICVGWPGVAINKTLVDQYDLGDISQIKRYEDLEPLLIACKEKTPGIFPLDAVKNHGQYPPELGIEPVPGLPIPLNIDKNNKIINPLGPYDEYRRARLELNRRWIEMGLVMDLMNQKNLNALASAGKVLVMYSQIKPGGEVEKKMQTGYEWVMIPTQEPRLDRTMCISTLQAISVTSENPERAMMLIELVNTDKELYNLLVFGIENKHYKKIGPNRIEPIKDSGYQGIAWAIG
ncbi:MAG: extracellular solute-binding protein, partial [Thermoanaerobacterium sp.]|nr:extracellular solute-binding protein [Thermoanaerobacterium sp.]